ncbi:hypothetical protein LINPERPRIM_LOCUS4450 [Linum perenne]
MNRTKPIFSTTKSSRYDPKPTAAANYNVAPPPATAATAVAATFKFPSSPEKLIWGEGIIHSGHPQHLLYKVDLPDLFTCSGCKEYGSGKSFTCRQCDFRLHEFCALAPPRLKAHPLHLQHQLLFSSRPAPKAGILQKSKCDVCGKATKGYTFRCGACTYQMHPCCAMLSDYITISIHPHPLKIVPSSSSSSLVAITTVQATPPLLPSSSPTATVVPAVLMDISSACGECKKKRSGRVYKCTVCEGYYLHAVCAKDMVNGLQANGIKGKEKGNGNKILGTAARVASQVVIEFLGGLVEGFGEGMGQVLVQSITNTKGSPLPAPATTLSSNGYCNKSICSKGATSGGCCGTKSGSKMK